MAALNTTTKAIIGTQRIFIAAEEIIDDLVEDVKVITDTNPHKRL